MRIKYVINSKRQKQQQQPKKIAINKWHEHNMANRTTQKTKETSQ